MLPGFRFRKYIKLFPGIRLNVSKSGVSTSIGKKGATVNLSTRGAKGTVGVPGTGMSYSKNFAGGKGYYAFLAAALGFYILYLFYTGEIKKYLPEDAIPTLGGPAVQEQPIHTGKPPAKHHRKKQHKARE